MRGKRGNGGLLWGGVQFQSEMVKGKASGDFQRAKTHNTRT